MFESVENNRHELMRADRCAASGKSGTGAREVARGGWLDSASGLAGGNRGYRNGVARNGKARLLRPAFRGYCAITPCAVRRGGRGGGGQSAIGGVYPSSFGVPSPSEWA